MKKNRRFSTALNVVAIALAYIVIRLALTASGNRSIENLLVQVSFNIIMVVSLNLVTGILGELTLEGNIQSLCYSRETKRRGSFWSRVF